MKQTLKLGAIALTLSAFTFASCESAPKGDEAKVTDEQAAATTTGNQTFAADTANSWVRFTGNGVGKNHPGKFKVSEGNVAVANNALTGGSFVININSMDMEEEGEMIDTKLRPHLLAPDFFDAEKYQTAKFEITKVEPYTAGAENASVVAGANYTVSGNLTLKDVTKNVTFPAKVDVTEGGVNAKANFDIDRTQWNMAYGNDKSLGDKFISETVNIELDLKANKL
ncbi:MAG: YceI family protein [Flavipsychrobacter sp.]|nr:YceI family protein [Flavipsychrobacter sp.]